MVYMLTKLGFLLMVTVTPATWHTYGSYRVVPQIVRAFSWASHKSHFTKGFWLVNLQLSWDYNPFIIGGAPHAAGIVFVSILTIHIYHIYIYILHIHSYIISMG